MKSRKVSHAEWMSADREWHIRLLHSEAKENFDMHVTKAKSKGTNVDEKRERFLSARLAHYTKVLDEHTDEDNAKWTPIPLFDGWNFK